MANLNDVFNVATISAIGVIITTLTTAFIRITVVKGKYRAQAADVLVDTALHERLVKEQYRKDNSDLRDALTMLIQIVDFNDFGSPTAPERFQKAAKAAKRALIKQTELSLETDKLVAEAEKEK